MPENVTILNHRREAINIVPRDHRKLEVQLQGGFKIEADFVYLTTGHHGCGADKTDQLYQGWVERGQEKNSHLAYFSIPYPIATLNAISPQANVAICGTGLTAADILSALTLGLGGTFEKTAIDRYKYIPCGREPRVTLFSRQGLPAGGRAINQKGVYGQYKARFFTRDFIEACREEVEKKTGNTQFDWDRDLLPMLKKEMAYAYHCIEKQNWDDPENYSVSAAHQARVEEILAPLGNRKFADADAYDVFTRQFLIDDIADCFEGNEINPLKGSADILRDIRDNIRYAVDYSGLTPASHKSYLSGWCSISNRIASGPPKERNMELLALIEAGIVTCGMGARPKISYDEERCQFTLTSTQFDLPKTDYFDVMIRAKVSLFEPETSTSELIRNLLKSGLIVPYENGDFKPSGIAVDEATNVINRDKAVIKNLWALGYIIEGAHFYTYVLPRPFSNSRALQDAGKAVIGMLAQIDAQCNDNNIQTYKAA